MNISSPVCRILDVITQSGQEAYVVGGCVRDSLRGVRPHDWDVTTSALPEELQTLFSGWTLVPTGLQHGTVTIISDGLPVEVTTYRTEMNYSDHRHPDNVQFTRSLREDLARRDFTINAMAYHPAKGIVDPFGGQKDLAAQRICCVGDPQKRFEEDALRIMRALRFSSVLSFALSPDTAAAVHWQAGLLEWVSRERIYRELLLLLGGNPEQVLLTYPDVLAVIMPEIADMKACPQRHPCHIYDVYTHTVKSLAAAPASDPILRLTVLMHDMGKPYCRTRDETGCDHFYGHAKKSAELARSRLQEWRADRYTVETVTRLVSLHDAVLPPTQTVVRRWLGRLGEEDFSRLIAVKRADTAGLSPHVQEEKRQALDELSRMMKSVVGQRLCFSRRQLAVNGHDLEQAGIPPGREMGTLLDALLEEVIAQRLPNEKEPLLAWALSHAHL